MPTTPCTIRRWQAGGPPAGLIALLRRATAAFAVAALLAAVVPAVAQEMDTSLGERVVMVPAGGITEPTLEVTVHRPPGDGPFPVMVVNHGRAAGHAKLQPRHRPVLAARAFVQRGWAVVVPMREGFSQSGGSEITGGCNVHSNGLQQAWADVARNMVLGQSHGGLTTLACGTDPRQGTELLVNFAGGLRQESCTAWQQNLIGAIGDYGAKATWPSLWFYGENDSFSPPFVWQGAHARDAAAGGRAEPVAFGSDAHSLFGSRAGLPIWLPRLLAALDGAGLPTQMPHALPVAADNAAPPASGFAGLTDLERLPVRTDRARAGYQTRLAAD